jgi:hypothetical protein
LASLVQWYLMHSFVMFAPCNQIANQIPLCIIFQITWLLPFHLVSQPPSERVMEMICLPNFRSYPTRYTNARLQRHSKLTLQLQIPSWHLGNQDPQALTNWDAVFALHAIVLQNPVLTAGAMVSNIIHIAWRIVLLTCAPKVSKFGSQPYAYLLAVAFIAAAPKRFELVVQLLFMAQQFSLDEFLVRFRPETPRP